MDNETVKLIENLKVEIEIHKKKCLKEANRVFVLQEAVRKLKELSERGENK